jgi:DNA-binding XRE family transcriptional regulator
MTPNKATGSLSQKNTDLKIINPLKDSQIGIFCANLGLKQPNEALKMLEKEKKHRIYSRMTLKSIQIFAAQIKMFRKERKLTLEDLAVRAGISRSTLQRIEAADPSCQIGVVFEVAIIAGVKLFGFENRMEAALEQTRIEDRLNLLPKRIRKKV